MEAYTSLLRIEASPPNVPCPTGIQPFVPNGVGSSTKFDKKLVDIVDSDGCVCFYRKRQNKKKVLPLLITPLPPTPSPPLQLQQPRRFTRKLYNPNSISDFNSDPMIHFPKTQHNVHYTDIQLPSTNLSEAYTSLLRSEASPPNPTGRRPVGFGSNVVPLLYLDQLIRTREDVYNQDQMRFHQNIITKEPSISSSIGLGIHMGKYAIQSSNNLVSRKIKNSPMTLSKQGHEKWLKQNLSNFDNQVFDNVFIDHILHLMSFKRRSYNEEKNKYDFFVKDDEHSVMAQADTTPILCIETSSEYRPASLPSDHGGVSYYSV